MTQLERFLLVAELAQRMRNEGSWAGETHLQKCVYFLQVLLGVPTDYDFMLYKHGPFSFTLREELGEMRSEGLVEVRINPQPYGPSFVATEQSRTLREHSSVIQRYTNQLDFVARRLGPKSVLALEGLSTALFVHQTEPGLESEAESAERIHSLKPHISSTDAAAAVREVSEIRAEAQMAAR